MTTKNINSLTQTYFLIGVNIKTLTKYLFHALITVSQNVVSVIRISLFVTETLFFLSHCDLYLLRDNKCHSSLFPSIQNNAIIDLKMLI